MSKQTVFRDVVLAVASKVFRLLPNDLARFDEDMVPSQKPPNGLGIEEVGPWLVYLNLVEAELHRMNPQYRALQLGPADARKTLSETILVTCIHIRDRILKLPKVPTRIASLERKAARLASSSSPRAAKRRGTK